MIIQTWGDSLTGAFQSIWYGIAAFVPNLIAAIIILIIGWIIAALLGRLVSQIIKAIKVDTALEQAGFGNVVKRAGFNLDSGAFLGGLVKWFVIVAFLVASFQVLGLTQVNTFLQEVVLLLAPGHSGGTHHPCCCRRRRRYAEGCYGCGSRGSHQSGEFRRLPHAMGHLDLRFSHCS